MGFAWTLVMRLTFHNFLYNCDNGSGKRIKFRATLFELQGDGLVVDSVRGGCWAGWIYCC